MKTLLILISIGSSVAGAGEFNPYPVHGKCRLVLDGGSEGSIETDLEKTVVLPASEICPSAELFLEGTLQGKTYAFSGKLLRNNGTDHLFIKLGQLVGANRVEVASAVAGGEVQLIPGATAYGHHPIIENNRQIGYFDCGMTVQAEGT